MRPLHDMITRSAAETMDQIEFRLVEIVENQLTIKFRATHEKDLCAKEQDLTLMEDMIAKYIASEQGIREHFF